MEYFIEHIIWEDIVTHDEWRNIEDGADLLKENFLVNTVGYNVAENDNHVILAQAIDANQEQMFNTTSIPKPVIKSRQILKYNG